MLNLKRIIHFNDFVRCDVTREIMTQGDYYYEDDDDGFIVKATVYKELMLQKKREEFSYAKLEAATSEREYAQMLKEYERSLKTQSIFDRKVAGKDVY